MDIEISDFIRYITVKKGLSPRSVTACRIRFSLIQKWFKKNNTHLTKTTVEQFFFELKQQGMKNNSLNTYVFTFRYIADYLKDRGRSTDFIDNFKSFKKNKPLIIILSPEEIEAIINTQLEYGRFRKWDSDYVTDYLNRIYTSLTAFLAYSGCRFDEASSLKVSDVDFAISRVIFRETKNKEYRFSYIPDNLLSSLKSLCKDKKSNEYVFTSVLGTKIREQEYVPSIKKRALKAGITKRVHPHLFRHSFATQLLMEGVDIAIVAAILGHKDIQTTYNNYVHLADTTLRNATFRHPLIRRSVQPRAIMHNVREILESLRLHTDSRFHYSITTDTNQLTFQLQIKQI